MNLSITTVVFEGVEAKVNLISKALFSDFNVWARGRYDIKSDEKLMYTDRYGNGG